MTTLKHVTTIVLVLGLFCVRVSRSIDSAARHAPECNNSSPNRGGTGGQGKNIRISDISLHIIQQVRWTNYLLIRSLNGAATKDKYSRICVVVMLTDFEQMSHLNER